MSVRLLHAVEVDAPPQAVWAAFCRLEDWPRWFPTLLALERNATGPLVVGDRFTLRLSFRGHAAAIPVRVLENDDRSRIRWVGKNLGVTGDHAFYVEALGTNRSRFVSDETFTGFPVRFVPKKIFGELETATREGLDRFAALVLP